MPESEEPKEYAGRHREQKEETSLTRASIGYVSNSCSMMIHQNCSDRRCNCWCHS